ncbi:spore germination protein [Paenibacillus sacheonensis]|nr:spore germination protein [Paenibacillus sacheonensis]MBM7566594.1 spore germination protein KA [Paenibacillus sacheonensis]
MELFYFEQLLSHAVARQPDFRIQRLLVDADYPVAICYLETLIDKAQLQQTVLLPLMDIRFDGEMESGDKVQFIRGKLAGAPPIEAPAAAADALVSAILEGNCIVFLRDNNGFALDIGEAKHRGIQEPKSEKTVRGPGEAFTEDVMTNVSLIRNRIKTPQLAFEAFEIGTLTKTKVLMAYIEGKASPERIAAYRERLSRIQTEAVLEGANVEEWIEEKQLTPFPRVLNTERPDVLSAHLIEGKIAILADGSPDCLIVPVTFFQFFISAEDYYQPPLFATLLRWLRLLAFVLAVYTPGMYIALTNYRQEMIPSALLVNLAAQREGVPFPAFVEAIIMLVMFELLREAGIRMPSVTGQAISIVGAVVLGQAAVEAGLVSAAMVIVVGITAIANFVTPSFTFGMAQRVLQFAFMVLAVGLALFGMFCGTLLMAIHLVSLKTTGEPYLTPLAPAKPSDFKDSLFRVPWYDMKNPKR